MNTLGNISNAQLARKHYAENEQGMHDRAVWIVKGY